MAKIYVQTFRCLLRKAYVLGDCYFVILFCTCAEKGGRFIWKSAFCVRGWLAIVPTLPAGTASPTASQDLSQDSALQACCTLFMWPLKNLCFANLLGDSVAQGYALKREFPISQGTPMVVFLKLEHAPMLTGLEAVVHVAGIVLSKDVE